MNEDNGGEGEWGRRKKENKWRERWVEGRDDDGIDHQHDHPLQSHRFPSHFRVLNAKNV